MKNRHQKSHQFSAFRQRILKPGFQALAKFISLTAARAAGLIAYVTMDPSLFVAEERLLIYGPDKNKDYFVVDPWSRLFYLGEVTYDRRPNRLIKKLELLHARREDVLRGLGRKGCGELSCSCTGSLVGSPTSAGMLFEVGLNADLLVDGMPAQPQPRMTERNQ